MPAHHNKHGIESIVAQQVEEWAIKFQAHYDEKIHNVHREQKETLAIVNRLGKYVNNLESKVNSITSNMKSLRNEDGEIDFPPEMNNYQSPGKNGNHNDDLADRLKMLETFCGYEPEREAYAALGLGTGELLLPDHKLSNRLTKIETTITKLDRNLRQVENELNDSSPDRNNNNYHSSGANSGNGIMATGLFLPEKTRPKSTHGDPRYRSRDSTPGGYHHHNNHNNHNAYTTPHPPAHNGTFGYRSAPSSAKSRAVSRPSSAPMGHGSGGPNNANSKLQKLMDDIRSQIEEVNDKNNMQNTFLMNELTENINSHEASTDRKLIGLDSKLRQYVNEVTASIQHQVSEGDMSTRSKIAQIEAELSKLQQISQQNEKEKEKAMEEKTRALEEEVASDRRSAHQEHEYERILQDKERASLELQQVFQKKEVELQRALQAKEEELRNLSSQNASTQEAYNQLQAEAKSEKAQLKDEHMKHIAALEQDFEARQALIDERTELYKAETQRLQNVHRELQSQVNLEIKQRTEQLQNEKEQLEAKLTEEMSAHNLQAQKDRIIKESLQNEIEMFKKSCNQAHHDKDQILAKLKEAEAKYAELEATLRSSPALQKHNNSIHNNIKGNDANNTSSPSSKSGANPTPNNTPAGYRKSSDPTSEEDQPDVFSYDTPISRFKSDPSDRRRSFQRADTPAPQQLVKAGGGRGDTPAPQNGKHLRHGDSGSGENTKPNFFLSPDTALKKQSSGGSRNSPLKKQGSRNKDMSKSSSSSSREKPRQEAAENENSDPFIGVSAVDDEKLHEMVQNKLTQNDIDDIIVLEELIKDRELELEQATAAKSRAKKKIKTWMSDFQKTNNRPPNQHEKEGVSDLYLNHQKLSETRDQLMETLEKMKSTLNERVNKVVE